MTDSRDSLTAPFYTAGVDEVGRGALFGPVVAAAVILPNAEVGDQLQVMGVTDSKQLSPQKRLALVSIIRDLAVDCRIGYASVQEIDRLNILQASLLAMKRAVYRLSPPPNRCLIDGNQPIPDFLFPQETWVKGDQRSVAIASASILAKVWRDSLIMRLAVRYPGYDLVANKGYGSPRHRAAIQALGTTRQHRKSFKTCQLSLF
jgi:ribonuclease HII